MSELTFVFGPHNSFFLDSPRAWKFHNLPHTLRQLFQSYMSPEWHIAQPFCLALGPQHDSPEPIWYCGARVMSGEEKTMYSQQFFDSNYPELSRWGRSIPQGSRNCRVTFGSAPFSFFACAPGHGSVWAAVPSELTDKVQKAFETPSCVALGVGDAWYVSWPHGSSAWNFHGAYADLDQMLHDAAPRLVTHLALSPYNAHHYFVAFNDHTVRYNFAGVPEWNPPVTEVLQLWHADLQRRQSLQHQNPSPPISPPWNAHAHAPVYVAAHYAPAPAPSPPASPYGTANPNPHPHPTPHAHPSPHPHLQTGAPGFVAELPAELPPTPTPHAPTRPASLAAPPAGIPAETKQKKKRFFAKLMG